MTYSKYFFVYLNFLYSSENLLIYNVLNQAACYDGKHMKTETKCGNWLTANQHFIDLSRNIDGLSLLP